MNEFCADVFKEKIRKARKDLHLTQEEVSKRIGIKRNTFARYETDTLPPLAMLYKISKVYGISIDYLLDPNNLTVTLPPAKPKTVKPRIIHHNPPQPKHSTKKQS